MAQELGENGRAYAHVFLDNAFTLIEGHPTIMNPGRYDVIESAARRPRPVKKALIIITVIFLTSASAWAQQRPKLAELFVDQFGVSVSGVWRPDNPTKKNELVEAITQLSCYRHGGKDLMGTEAFCLQATAMAPDGLLDVSTNWLKVIEWSDTQIIAIDDSSICLTSQTIFDVKRKTVIALDIRKPEAQGFKGACNLVPDRQTYYFQDKADYFAHRSAAK